MQIDTYIPRRLDDAWKIGIWDADVAFPVLIGLLLGYLSSTRAGFLLCALVGIALSRWLARIKADKHRSFAMHWAYWALPVTPITALRATPPSHLRRMVG